MAAVLPTILYECDGQAPAPSKDFYHLIVTRTEINIRYWKISLRNEFRGARPGEVKESHQDFVDDPTLQGSGYWSPSYNEDMGDELLGHLIPQD